MTYNQLTRIQESRCLLWCQVRWQKLMLIPHVTCQFLGIIPTRLKARVHTEKIQVTREIVPVAKVVSI